MDKLRQIDNNGWEIGRNPSFLAQSECLKRKLMEG